LSVLPSPATSHHLDSHSFPTRRSSDLLNRLEQDIVDTANKLGIGPMGFGGKTTLLGTKIGVLNRLPASYFVSVSYMCWAYRRQGDRKSTRLNSSHRTISYAVFCLKKKN